MSLLEERQKTSNAILEGRFIAKVLNENAQEIDKAITAKISGFSSSFWSDRNFAVQNTTLVYTTKLQHRFLDMKTRQKNGTINRKKNYAIHNKPIFGHLNNIIRELNFGFTEAIKNDLTKLDNTNI
ncbi:hypothetical protein [Lutibacter sp.]|uniref:hypothetical protein n=1 Tax=Lutibacter sp. TaxID=1925666 RepID=UPI0035651DAA